MSAETAVLRRLCPHPLLSVFPMESDKGLALRGYAEKERCLSAEGISAGDGGRGDTTRCQVFTK